MARKKHAGHQSPAGQGIANALPPWHVVRTDPATVGRQVLNVPAMSVEDIQDQTNRLRRNLYPETADTLVRWDAWYARVPDGLLLKEAPDQNLLANAAFDRKGMAHRNIPVDWVVGEGKLAPEGAVGNAASVKFALAPGETGEISAWIERKIEAGRRMTLSVYGKGSGDWGMVLGGTVSEWGPDFVTGESDVSFSPGGWTRASVSFTPPRRGNYLRYAVRAVNTDTGEVEVLLSAPQVNVGALTDWLPSRDDIGDQLFLLSAVSGDERIPLRPAASLDDFYEDALPTRLTVAPGLTGELLEPRAGPLWPEADGSRWESRWVADTGEIRLDNANIARESFASYALADRYPWNASGDLEYEAMPGTYPGFSRTIEKLVAFRGRLYVLCLETQDGVTARTLKVVDAHGLDGELDVLTDLAVGVDTGSVTRLGFVEGHMERLAFQLDDADWYTIDLAFDTYYLDRRSGRVLLRHPYTGYDLTFTEF